jgi:hypothetical protein
MKSTIQPTVLNTMLASPMLEEDAIRLRAYGLYAKRGMLEGHALDDWLEAKADLLSGSSTTSKTEPKIKAHT